MIRWETHARPGFGADAQEVINQQLPDDYDIFIGVMGTRFGTPTGRAGSGTEEEFNRVFERLEKDKTSVSIMLYFKEGLVEQGTLDLKQLGAVRVFKERASALGGLYWTFRTTEEFQGLLRVHLASEVTEWEKCIEAGQASPAEIATQDLTTIADALLVGDELDEEMGFPDFLVESGEKFEEATAAVNLIGEALTTLGERIGERAEQFRALASPSGEYDTRAAKRLSKRTAEDMEQFVSRAAAETPIMAAAVQRALQAFGNAACFALEAGPSACEGLGAARDSVVQMRASMSGSLDSITGLRESVASLPRIQKDLNVAKRKTVAAIDAFLREVRSGDNLAATVDDSMNSIFRELNCPEVRRV